MTFSALVPHRPLSRFAALAGVALLAWSLPFLPGLFQAQETKLEGYRVPLDTLAFESTNHGRSFVSEVIRTGFEYESLGARWQLPQGSRLYVKSVGSDGRQSQFALLHDDNPRGSGEEFSDPLFVEKGRGFQYRIELPAGASLGTGDHVVLSYLSSPVAEGGGTEEVMADNGMIKPRSAWGADESLRTLDGWLKARQAYCAKTGCSAAVPQVRTASQAMPEVGDEFPDEAKVIREEWKMDGKELVWPEEYVKSVKKFVVHHTAENLNDSVRSLDEISQAEYQAHIRSVYYYHAIVRGWGDIGYNYIIDPLGNVYQGRAGGDGVIAAHASGSNQGSVGISVMGNYETGQPPVRAIRSLEKLLGTLGTKHKIDPAGQTTFRGKKGPAVLSHRDLGQTSCPGGNLYDDLPSIRMQAHQSFTSSLSEASVVSGSTSVSGTIGQKVAVELKVRNDSSVTWEKNKIQLTLFKKRSRSLMFDSRSWSSAVRPGTMVEESVAPGGTATWRFSVIGRKVGTITEQFQFNILGKGWLKGDPLTLSLNVGRRTGGASPSTAAPTVSPIPTATPVVLAQPATASNPEIRIKLGYTDADDKAALVSDRSVLITSDTDSKLVKAGTAVAVSKTGTKVSAVWDGGSLSGTYVHFAPTEEGIVTVSSWNRGSSSNSSIRYNMFRGAVRSIIDGGRLVLVNHIRLEDYLIGMAESYNGEFPEMRKVMSVLTRSYALHYTDPANRKFPGKPYDGSDSPAEFQYYLGYGFETAAPNWVQTVKDMRGMVVKYDGKVVKTPYFSASDGTMTKDSKAVWGWSLPFLVPVDDSFCAEKAFRGHGVGLSACGAREMAKQGKSYDEIIKYYYKGVTIGQA